MPTVIDSLIVTLGLDPSGFTKGQKEAAAAFAKTRDEMRKTASEVERSAQNMASLFGKIRNEVLGFASAVIGTQALVRFAAQVTASDAALGRLANTLGRGIGVEQLSAWGQAVQHVTGNSSAATAAFKSWTAQLEQFRLTGEGSFLQVLRAMAQAGGEAVNVNRPLVEQFAAMAHDLQAIAKTDPARAMALGKMLGFNEDFVYFLMQGEKAIHGQIDAQKQLGVVTKEEAGHAQYLVGVYTDLWNTAKRFGDLLLYSLTKPIDDIIHKGITFDDSWGKAWHHVLSDAERFVAFMEGLGSRMTAAFKSAFGGAFAWLKGQFNDIWQKVFGFSLFAGLNAGEDAAVAAGAGRGPGRNAMEDAQAGRLPGYGGRGGLRRGHSASQLESVPGAWWTPGRQAHAIDYLMNNAGLSREGAAGLVARWSSIEARGGPSSVNPISGAFGIGQWLGSRKRGIAGNTDFDAQLAHAANELNTSERRAGNALRAAKTAAAGARGASMYERAEGYNAATGTDNFTGRTPVQSVLDRTKNTGTGTWWDAFSRRAPAGVIGSLGQQSSIANDNRQSSVNTSSSQTTIGSVSVHTQATDAAGIARDIGPALARNNLATQANYGIT